MIKNGCLLLNQMVRQKEGNIVSDMDGEKVMLSIHNGKYYNLGEIGGDIWMLIKDPICTKDLIDMLMVNYDVSQNECEEQVLSFLNLLSDEDLILVEEVVQ
ncbi:lasso peptide biosynthesis PqqD family chaperone [Virgibacillus flavescens]|uniref:lasso peptide biosynthesis PqqD family chaperone n=1 Tax=Virgibacillus flavescens TaxID=1611422 RepID=UPI003D33853E